MAAKVDLNHDGFQQDWFALPKDQQLAILAACRKIKSLTWEQIYRDKGLRWEAIKTRAADDGSRLYSIRLTGKMRAIVRRKGEYLEFLSLHADHDSAYD
jgi:hypothetical protein